LQIQIGSEIEVEQLISYDSSVVIKVNKLKKIHVSHKAAENLLIRKI
jgi:hypothetical protein